MITLALLLFGCADKSPSDDTGPSETGSSDTGSSDTGIVPPVFTTEARWSSSDDWEPSVAASGDDVYQITTRIGADHARVILRRSTDRGETWGEDMAVNPDGTDAYDPQVAVAAETGCVFVAWLDTDWATWVKHSCDGGESWSDDVRIRDEGQWTDHAWLLVSPDGQDLSLAFNGGVGESEDESSHGYVVTSHDGGATFEEAYDAGESSDRYWFPCFGGRNSMGTLYFSAARYTSDYHGDAELYVWRSTDNGDTWESAPVATSAEPADCDWADGCEFGFFAAQIAVAVDEDGTALIAWQQGDEDGAPQALYVARTDAESWPDLSEPQVLSSGANHAFPMLAAGPSPGDFRLLYQASVDGEQTPWNTWYQLTPDAGDSWLAEPVRLSDAAAGTPYKSEQGYTFPYGDYLGLAVDGEGAATAIWGEGPGWNGPGGTWWARELPGG